ncbi:MAG: TIGR03557 family F420-dependent LLM class oxidoreductase [Acidimicrobiia bacterium]
MKLGYWLSSEEHDPPTLVTNAVRAEGSGFSHAAISDHFHPWTERQGQSPFVWSILGAIANATERLRLVTGVTAPIIRLHPAVVAHAAATAAVLFDGRFSLGVGTGERLNEHVTGQRWPRPDERREMLAEAIGIIPRLWSGETLDHRGEHFTVERAKLFTRPAQTPDIIVASGSLAGARLAGRHGDGLLGVTPNRRHVEAFEAAGGRSKRRLAQLHVCWAPTQEEAEATALAWWPNAALTGAALTDLAFPTDFEELLGRVSPNDVASTVAVGPDPERHLELITKFAKAGFDELYIHQIGPDQSGFLEFFARHIAPQIVTSGA